MTVEELDVAKGLCSRASPKDLGIRCLPKTRTTRGESRAPSETSSAINSSAFVIAMVRKLAKDRHLAIATRLRSRAVVQWDTLGTESAAEAAHRAPMTWSKLQTQITIPKPKQIAATAKGCKMVMAWTNVT